MLSLCLEKIERRKSARWVPSSFVQMGIVLDFVILWKHSNTLNNLFRLTGNATGPVLVQEGGSIITKNQYFAFFCLLQCFASQDGSPNNLQDHLI